MPLTSTGAGAVDDPPVDDVGPVDDVVVGAGGAHTRLCPSTLASPATTFTPSGFPGPSSTCTARSTSAWSAVSGVPVFITWLSEILNNGEPSITVGADGSGIGIFIPPTVSPATRLEPLSAGLPFTQLPSAVAWTAST